MGKSNYVYELPSESVTIYLDRYCAQRLLLALTQALEPPSGQKYYKKTKKGKGWGPKTGIKLTKGGERYGIKLSKGGEDGGMKMSKGAEYHEEPPKAVSYVAPEPVKVSYTVPKASKAPKAPKATHKRGAKGGSKKKGHH